MFEADYQKHVELPAWFPFEILEREAKVYDKKLEIDYHGKQARDTMILFVEPHAEKIKPYAVDQSIELVDGTTAYFRVKHPGFFQLDVQKEGLLYRIWVGTNSTKRISTSTMKDIADSMKKKSQLPA